MKYCLLIFLFISANLYAKETSPNCSGIQRWATSSAYIALKDKGLLTEEGNDFSKTVTKLIASEKIGKDLYTQVHQITFTNKNGSTVEVITVNNASSEECSMNEVKVYVVAREI
jgi:hypothetical protein